MMAKIEQGKTYYDLAFPSEYTVEMMKEKGLLEKLDHSKIVGLDNIDERFLDQAYDPGNEYSIPYFWGTFGILYNTEKYRDRKSTRLNSSHVSISYAVFCLKKKNDGAVES